MTDPNRNLSEELREFWGTSPESKIIIVGIGRTIRGDESTGLLIAEELAKTSHRNTLVIKAEDRPENYTEQIRHFNPTHILYLLTTRSGRIPGETHLITLEEHSKTSLHESPLTTLDHYLSNILSVETRLLLIEPWTEMGEPSRLLKEAARKIAAEINKSLQ
jgi:hydrogenase maturation protease